MATKEIKDEKTDPRTTNMVRGSADNLGWVRQPPHFHGKRYERVEDFLREYEYAAVADGIDEARRRIMLPVFLHDDAQMVYKWAIAPHPELTWTEVKEKLRIFFERQPNEDGLMEMFINRKQTSDEDVQLYIIRMYDIAMQMEPSMLESRIIGRILANMLPVYRDRLGCADDYADVEDLVKRASSLARQPTVTKNDMALEGTASMERRLAELTEAVQRMGTSTVVHPVNAMMPLPAFSGNQFNRGGARGRSSRGRGRFQQDRTSRGNVICYRCNRQGHYKANCPFTEMEIRRIMGEGNEQQKALQEASQFFNQPQAQNNDRRALPAPPAGYGGAHRANCITFEDLNFNYEYISEPMVESICLSSGEWPESTEELIREVVVDDKRCYALVDSGATGSLIAPWLVDLSRIEKARNVVVRGISGTYLNIIGKLTAKVTMTIRKKTRETWVDFYVIDEMPYDLVLGRNGNKALGLVIEFGKKGTTINFNNKEETDLMDENVDLICSYTEQLPPHSSKFIKVEHSQRFFAASGNIMVQSQPGGNSAIQVPNSVFSDTRGLYKDHKMVMVTNMSHEEQYLQPGDVVGQISELKQCRHEREKNPLKNEGWNHVFDGIVQGEAPTPELGERLKRLILDYQDVFAIDDKYLGCHKCFEFTIELTDPNPICVHPYPMARDTALKVQSMLDKMKEDGIIEDSRSPYNSPLVAVRKPDESIRICVDFRRINVVIKNDAYPLPRIDVILHTLSGAQYFSTCDLRSGFYEMKLEDGSKEITAFTSPAGHHYQFKRVPFGLKTAPAKFQRMMDMSLAGLKWNTLLLYIDDIIVFSRTFEDHLYRLEEMFQRLRDVGLTLKPNKCVLAVQEVKILGHIVSNTGITMDPEKVKAIAEQPTPKSVTDLQKFLGAANYYRKYIQNYAKETSPLTQMLRKEENLVWGEDQDWAFHRIKRLLTSEPTLVHFNNMREHELRTDASRDGIGGILLQRETDGWKPVVFCSRTLSPAEQNYTISELECLAVVYCCKKCNIYLIGKHFTVQTDHIALTFIMKKKELPLRLLRWSLLLSDYDFEIKYRPGAKMHDVDFLSRYPIGDDDDFSIDEERIYINTLVANLSLEDIFDEQQLDPFAKEKLRQLDYCSDSLFVNHEGLLYRLVRGPFSRYLALYIPKCYREDVLRFHHDEMFAGHRSIEKTYASIRIRHYWKSLHEDVTNYVNGCETCKTRKRPVGGPVGLMQPIFSEGPWCLLSIDAIGPYPKSKSGNKYIISCIDVFTKFLVTKAVPNIQATTTADFLIDLFCTYGSPQALCSDRGTNFLANVVKILLVRTGITQQLTTAYHPQGNSIIERMNGVISTMLSHYCSTKQDDWDVALRYINFGINSGKHDTTRFSAFKLMFGREALLPHDVERENDIGIPDPDDYGQILTSYLELVHAAAKEWIKIGHDKNKTKYDEGRRDVLYSEGDQVSVFKPTRVIGKSEKLMHRNWGPYTVVRRVGIVNYEVRLRGARKTETVHVSRMARWPESFELASDSEPESENVEDGVGSNQATAGSEPITVLVNSDENEVSQETSTEETTETPIMEDESADETIMAERDTTENGIASIESNATPVPRNASTPVAHNTRSRRRIDTPAHLRHLLPFSILFLICSIGTTLAISPVNNHTWLAAAGSHGLRVAPWGSGYFFHGVFEQIIEFRMNHDLLQGLSYQPMRMACDMLYHNNSYMNCLALESMTNAIYTAAKEYKEKYEQQLKNLLQNAPTTDWLDTLALPDEIDRDGRKRGRGRKKDRNNEVREKRETERSILPVIGDALKVLFGTATTSDMGEIRNNVEKLRRTLRQSRNETVTLKDEMIGLTRLQEKRVTNLADSLRLLGNTVKEIEQYTSHVRTGFANLTSDINGYRSVQRRYNHMFAGGLLSLYNLTLLAQSVKDLDSNFVQLRRGYLPIAMLPWLELKKILKVVEKTVAPYYALGIDEEEYNLYYMIGLVKFALIPGGIMIRLSIPLRTKNEVAKYQLLAPITSPVPCEEEICAWHARLENKESFVTLLIKDRAWVTNGNADSLVGEADLSTLSCSSFGEDKICVAYDPSLMRTVSSCSRALFGWEQKEILKYCNFELSVAKDYTAIRLSPSSFVVHRSVIPQYDVVCNKRGSSGRRLQQWAEIVYVSEGCYLKAEDITLYGPLAKRDSRLDTVNISPPQFLFQDSFLKTQFSSTIEDTNMGITMPGYTPRLNMSSLENSLQLDQRYATLVTDKLWEFSGVVKRKLMDLEKVQKRRAHHLDFISMLNIVTKLSVILVVMWISIINIRRGFWCMGVGAIYEVLPVSSARSELELDDVEHSVYDTINEAPTDLIVSVILVFLSAVLAFAMYKGWFRTVLIKSHVASYRHVYNDSLTRNANARTFLYISLIYKRSYIRYGKWREITIKTTTNCFPSGLEYENITVICPTKIWFITNGHHGLEFKLATPVKLLLTRKDGHYLVLEQEIALPLSNIDYNFGGEIKDFEEGAGGEAHIVFIEQQEITLPKSPLTYQRHLTGMGIEDIEMLEQRTRLLDQSISDTSV